MLSAEINDLYALKHHVTRKKTRKKSWRWSWRPSSVFFVSRFRIMYGAVLENEREKCFMILLVHPDFFNYDLSIFQNDWLLKKLIEKCFVADKMTRESLMVLTASALGERDQYLELIKFHRGWGESEQIATLCVCLDPTENYIKLVCKDKLNCCVIATVPLLLIFLCNFTLKRYRNMKVERL